MTQVGAVEPSVFQADSAGSIPVTGSTKNTLPQGNSHNPPAAGLGTVPQSVPYVPSGESPPNRAYRPSSAGAGQLPTTATPLTARRQR